MNLWQAGLAIAAWGPPAGLVGWLVTGDLTMLWTATAACAAVAVVIVGALAGAALWMGSTPEGREALEGAAEYNERLAAQRRRRRQDRRALRAGR